ncbi:hypothetical protein ACQUQP_09790 [Marinobacterium sp. YM272]|uniref:hypothetical protein n=1 Tax=Marinobacterium sp. YM272 TaxID=3421654 RepID=UPI003D7FCA56
MRPAEGCLGLLLVIAAPVQAQDEQTWGDDAWGGDSWAQDAAGPAIHGFYEAALGGRLQDDPALAEDKTLAEVRAHLEWAADKGAAHYSLKGDLYADAVENGVKLDLREAMVQLTPLDWLDLQVGQQVSTWGTGDMLFLNDLFPKDWKSFFAGRDETYLKAPAPSIRISLYAERFSLDLVWTPVFEPDRYIDGERFSYFSPLSGTQLAVPDGKLHADEPNAFPQDGEFAARLSGRQQSLEWALYGYRGFWKQPLGLDKHGEPTFPRLDVYGASLRGPLAGGIANTEIAWYEGKDDAGDNPRTPNDQLRWLVGFDHELVPNLNGAVQYYLEWTQDYDQLKLSSPDAYRPDELRQVVTLRLTWKLMRDNLTLSWFNYYSPTDQDYYLRPSLSYRIDDHWTLSSGANLFGGDAPHTFFGQFEDGSNLWARLRYGF